MQSLQVKGIITFGPSTKQKSSHTAHEQININIQVLEIKFLQQI
jgi:hypothetical protein